MTTARKRLPNRRSNISVGFECGGHNYRAMASFFDDGTLGEIFLSVPGRLGSSLQQNADTAAILASLLLQHGVDAKTIMHSVSGPIAIALAKFSPGGAE